MGRYRWVKGNFSYSNLKIFYVSNTNLLTSEENPVVILIMRLCYSAMNIFRFPSTIPDGTYIDVKERKKVQNITKPS